MTITVNPFLAAIAAIVVSVPGLLILGKLSIMPTQADVQDLADRLFALGPKIDALKAAQTPATPLDLSPIVTAASMLEARVAAPTETPTPATADPAPAADPTTTALSPTA